jgi:hypothetical protein
MWPAFPASDYYEDSAPPRGHQLTMSLPAADLGGRRGGRPGVVPDVHLRPVDGVGAQLCPCSIAMGTPQSFSMASWLARSTNFGVARSSRTCTAARPISTRLEPVPPLRGFTRWFLTYTFSVSLAEPRPSGSSGPSRRCRGCSHPHLHLQVQTAPSFTRLLRQASGGVLSSPPGSQTPRGARPP